MHTITRALLPTAAFGLLFFGLRRSNKQQGRINGALCRAVLTAEEQAQAMQATLFDVGCHGNRLHAAILDMGANLDRTFAEQAQRVETVAAVTAELSGAVYSIREAVEGPNEAVEAPEEAVTADV